MINGGIELDIKVPNQTKYLSLIGRIGEDIAREIDRFSGDRETLAYQLNLVLTEAMSNAIKYNRPNGSVIITGNFTDADLSLNIQDTGLGIPEDAVPHLFEKFFRVREHEGKAAGTGLGLSICKQIIQGHNGRIEVKSKMGVGTSFNIFLPRAPRAIPPMDG